MEVNLSRCLAELSWLPPCNKHSWLLGLPRVVSRVVSMKELPLRTSLESEKEKSKHLITGSSSLLSQGPRPTQEALSECVTSQHRSGPTVHLHCRLPRSLLVTWLHVRGLQRMWRRKQLRLYNHRNSVNIPQGRYGQEIHKGPSSGVWAGQAELAGAETRSSTDWVSPHENSIKCCSEHFR